MIVRRFQSAHEFLDAAQSMLTASEAENNLLLGIAHGLAQNPAGSANAYLATVSHGASILGCAAQLASFKLVVAGAPDDCMSALAEDAHQIVPLVPGVTGPGQSARDFATAWGRLRNRPVILERRLQIYELRQVADRLAALARGRLRAAVKDDETMLSKWTTAFVAEAGIHEPVDANRIVAEGIARGRLYVWDDGRPVSMAAWAGRTPNGVRINFVYTPPEHRRNGYATACVSALSRHQLAGGRAFCWVYTEPAPARGSLFSRIGYRHVTDIEEYRF
jgi:predicted GNAT family acetyltransferase